MVGSDLVGVFFFLGGGSDTINLGSVITVGFIAIDITGEDVQGCKVRDLFLRHGIDPS